MRILSIENSCDETSVTVINNYKILYNEMFSQSYLHNKYGGLVPLFASRNHSEYLYFFLNRFLLKLKNISKFILISVTGGPGLVKCIEVSCIYGKLLSLFFNKRFISINHLLCHTLIIKFTNKNIKYPFILILISGGHFLISIVYSYYNIFSVARTTDDSIGEIFDKVAQMIGLGFPGGPEIEKCAEKSYTLIKKK